MAVSFELNAKKREQLGRRASRRMRRTEGCIPAVIYGAGKPAQSITLDHNKVIEALEHEAFYSHILTINIDGTQEKAILRDMQRHAFKPKILHVDFQRISAKEKLTLNVPLHFTGEAEAIGVKAKGGVVTHHVTTVEVSCLPTHLPEFIEVDIRNLDLDEALHLSQLKIPKEIELVELMHQNDLAVVSIHIQKIQVEEEPSAEISPEAETPGEPKEEPGEESK